MEILKSRKVINPILVVAGILTMVSGVCMFFHFKSPLMVHIHEVLGLVLVIVSVLHLILNWRPLLKTINGFPVRVITLVLIVGLSTWMLVSTAASPGMTHHKQRGEGGPGHGPGSGPGGGPKICPGTCSRCAH